MSTSRRSEREEQILRLIARDRTNSEIAEELGISFATAKWHVSELLSKEGVSSREELAELWRAENGLRPRMRRWSRGWSRGWSGSLLAKGAALAGLAIAGGLFVLGTTGGGAGSGSREDPAEGSPGTVSEPAIDATSAARSTADTRQPNGARLSEAEAEAAGRRLLDTLLARGSQDLLDGAGRPLTAANLAVTRLEFRPQTSHVKYTDGGVATVTESDLWIVEFRMDDVRSGSANIPDGVFTAGIAITDDAHSRLLGGNTGLTPDASLAPLGMWILAAWPLDTTVLSLAGLAGAPDGAPTGVCVVRSANAASYRVSLDGRDITSAMRGSNASTLYGEDATTACYRPSPETGLGTHIATFETFDAAGNLVQAVERRFEIAP